MKKIINIRPWDTGNQFKNREHRISEINNFLLDQHTRIICITGRGGIGKTALISKILEPIEADLQSAPQGKQSATGFDGILYLTAQSTTLTLERIYNDIAKILDETDAELLSKRWQERESSLLSKIDFLLEIIQKGRYIILLDNFESYLDDNNTINNEGLSLFLERCLLVPFVSKIVITTRTSIKNLAVPFNTIIHIDLKEGLPSSDTIQLIRELDSQNLLGFNYAQEGDLQYVANLTMGIPRAVEIIMGIIQNDPFIDISNIIEDNKLYRDAIVEQLYANGFQLLSPDDRKIIQTLAILNKPSGIEAVAFILSKWLPEIQVKQKLKSLILKKFVQFNRSGKKFSLHPLDQYYAYNSLTTTNPDDNFTRTNLELTAADYYATIKKPKENCRNFDEIVPYLLEFQHRINGKDFTGAFYVMEPIVRSILLKWGYTSLIIEYITELLKHLTEKKYIAISLGNLGAAKYAVGQVHEAIELLNAALELIKDTGEQKAGAWMADLGVAYYTLGEFEFAREIFSKALELAVKTGDKINESGRLGHLALIERNLGNTSNAKELYQKALRIAREIDNKLNTGIQVGSLGTVYLETGDLVTAKTCYEEALNIAYEVQDKRRQDVWLGHLGMVYSYQNENKTALQYFNNALTICNEIGDNRHEVNWLNNIGRVYYRQDNLETALTFFQDALTKAESIGYNRARALVNLGIGKILLLKNDVQGAVQHFENSQAFKFQLIDSQAEMFIEIAAIKTKGIADPVKVDRIKNTCLSVLQIEKDIFGPGFVAAFALILDAVVKPAWQYTTQRYVLLEPALNTFKNTLEICNAPGIVLDTLQDLTVFQNAGIENLNIIRNLLSQYSTDDGDI